jgi:hypothetical protein
LETQAQAVSLAQTLSLVMLSPCFSLPVQAAVTMLAMGQDVISWSFLSA